MKKLFLFIFATMLAGQVWAGYVVYSFDAVCSSGQTLYYKITSDTTVAVACPYEEFGSLRYGPYTTPSGDLIIPKTVVNKGKTYYVTSIGEEAFRDCYDLTLIVIPNSIKSIGRSAFMGNYTAYCEAKYKPSGWQSQPSSVVWNTRLVNGMIFKITSDMSPYTASAIKYIGGDSYCEIPSVIVDSIEYMVVEIGEGTFSGCKNLASVTIPNTIINIGSNTFSGCSELTSVTIPNSITNIGENAFNGCEKLDYNVYDNGCYVGNDDNPYFALFMTKKLDITSCSINNKCKIICGGAFSGCSNLPSITIPESVVSINTNAFNNCNKLEKAEFASINSFCGISFENENSNPLTYAHHLYINGEEVTDLVIPNTVTAIGNYAFYGCNNLKSVSIPNTITGIGDYAFNGCNGLKSLTIPKSVVGVGKSTFNGCDSLTSVTTESNADFSNSALCFKENILKYQVLDKERVEISGVDYISALYVFPHSIEKTRLTISKTVTAGNTYNVVGIGKSAFAYIGNLISIIIPNSVTNIGESAFNLCSALESITIPESVTNIDTLAFNYCDNIETLEFNTNAIGRHFSGKNMLKAVHIGESVTIINTNSFADCILLTTVTSAAAMPPALPTGDPFPNADTIYVKAESVEAYQTASYWKRKVILPYNTVAIKNVSDSTGTIDGSRFLLGEKGTTLTAVPAVGYHFVSWNDGNKDNPRFFSVTPNTSIIAIFEAHIEVVDAAVEATCTKSGKTEGSHCDICKAVLVVQKTISAKGHTIVIDPAVAATATESGLTEGSHCSECGKVLVAQEVIPALGEQGGENTNPTTAVTESAANAINIFAHGNIIVIENATEEIRVYNAMGALVGRDVARNVSTITVNGTGVYIVKTGGMVKRVMVN